MTDSESNPDCFMCRAIGAAFGVGSGAYVAMHAPPSGLKRWGVLIFASGLGALGLARAFNTPPFGGFFRSSKS